MAIAQKKIKKLKKDNSSSLNSVKSLKIPEDFDEKAKLLQGLKTEIEEINLKIKNFISKREYYSEIVGVLEKQLKERSEKIISTNKENSQISIIQEELYSKL